MEAWFANINYVCLEPGEENTPHTHTRSEDTIFILEGEGTIHDFTNGKSLAFHAGRAVHVPGGIKHEVAADKGVGIVGVGEQVRQTYRCSRPLALYRDKASPKMPTSIAAVQFTAIPGQAQNNRARTLDFIHTAATRDARIVVLPELAVSGYCLQTELCSNRRQKS